VFRREGSTGRTAGLAIGVGLALAACSSAPADDPETTAQRFLRALAVNELDKACLTTADGVPFGVQDLPECNNFLGAVAAEPDNQVAKYAHAKVRSAAVQDDPARVVAQVGPIGPRVRAGRAWRPYVQTPPTHVGIQSWLIEGTLVVPDDVSSEIGHAVGGRAGLDQ
jgi:hypothetical protein